MRRGSGNCAFLGWFYLISLALYNNSFVGGGCEEQTCFLSSPFVDKDSGSEKLSDLPKVTQLRVTELGQGVHLPPSSGALSAPVGVWCRRTQEGDPGAFHLHRGSGQDGGVK